MFSVNEATREKLVSTAKIVNGYSELLQELGEQFDSTAKALRQKGEDIKNGEFKILVVGRFKNGKSTFVNAVLGKQTMATKSTACTAVIAVVSEGPDEDTVTLHFTDGKTKRMTSAEFTEEYQITQEEQFLIDSAVEDEKDVILDRFSNIAFAEMHSRHSMFKNGISLIDTPGLEEALSRDKTTKEYLPKAQAIIFMLNARALFSKAEKEFIKKNFVGKNMQNVFFIVNAINQLHPGQLENEIIPAVEIGLRDVFTTSDGVFDKALYNDRVFYVDAYGAECTRTGRKVTILQGRKEIEFEMDIDDTGVPEFEEELDNFLNSDARVQATLSSALTPLYDSYASAVETIEMRKSAMSMSEAEIQENIEKAKGELNKAEDIVEEIEKAFETFAKNSATSLYLNLLDYIERNVKGEYPAYVQNTVTGKNYGATTQAKNALANIVGMLPSEKAKQWAENQSRETFEPFLADANAYVEHKINEWKLTTDTVIARDAEVLVEELETLCGQFDTHVDAAVNVFVSKGHGPEVKRSAKSYLQVFIGIFAGKDLSAVSDIFTNGGELSWGELISKYIGQSVIDTILLAISPAAVFLKFGIDLLLMQINSKKNEQKIMIGFGNQCIDAYRKAIIDNELSFKKGIIQNVTEKGKQVSGPARELLKSKQDLFEKAATDARKSKEDNNKELDRLNNTLGQMRTSIETLFHSVYERDLSDSEFDKLVFGGSEA